MPTLLPHAFVDKSNEPYYWQCSECNEGFSLERLSLSPTEREAVVRQINSEFEKHCLDLHPRTPVIGID